MPLVILFLSLSILCLVALSFARLGNPKFVFKRTFGTSFEEKSQQRSFFEIIGNSFLGKNPGWLVQKISNEKKIAQTLARINNPISAQEVLGYKQACLHFFIWGGVIYSWIVGLSWGLSFSILGILLFFFYLVDLWIIDHKQRFHAELNKELPYFLDLLSLVLETGKGVEQSFAKVCQAQNNALTQTIAKHLNQMNLGISFQETLQELKLVLRSEIFDSFVTSVLQTQKLGVSLSQTLKLQSELLSTKKRQAAEEMSRTASVKISLPLVLFIFPALLLLYIGPGVLHLIYRGAL